MSGLTKFHDDVLATLHSIGLMPENIVADGKNQRCPVAGKPNKKDGSYRIYVWKGEVVLVATNWLTGESIRWTSSSGTKLSRQQKRALERGLAKIEETEAKSWAKAAERARNIFDTADECEEHAYITGKGVGLAPDLKMYTRGRLLVPAYDKDGVLTSLQSISLDGEKRFLPGGRIGGCYFSVGDITNADIILVGEGLATMLSLHECTGHSAVVAFFAGNLLAVAKAIRELAPNAKIIICADNDVRDDGSINTGVEKATEAALDVGAYLAVPVLKKKGQYVKCDFNDLHLKKGKAHVRAVIANAKKPTGHLTSLDKAQGKLPYGYSVTLTGKRPGLWYAPESADVKPVFIGPPLHVLAYARDEDSKSWGLLLEWQDADGIIHRWVMPYTALHGDNTAAWLGPLVDGGWRPATAKGVVSLLRAYLAAYTVNRRALGVTRMGWHRDTRVYVLPEETIGECGSESIVMQMSIARNPFQKSGSFRGWQKSIGAMAVGNSRLVFMISASTAGCLLGLINLDSGGFNKVGESSTGKSTALRVAASAWGKGTSSGGYIRTWRATSNGLEGIAAMHSDSVLCLDEIGEAPRNTIAEASYMLANGTGKTRARPDGSAKPAKDWRVMYLSTGEKGLEAAIAEFGGKVTAGQLVRLVDIPADAGAGMGVFENIHDCSTSQEFADALNAAAATHYGHLAPAFIARVIENKDAVIAKLTGGLTPKLAKLCGDDPGGQVGRVAKRFHLCAVAGELAAEWGLVPWPKGEATRAVTKCFKAWLEYRGGTGAAENMAIVRQLELFLEQHGPSRFQDLDDEDSKPLYNRVGFRRSQSGRTEYIFLPESFRQDVFQGFDVKRVASVLAKYNLLLPGDSGLQRKVTLPGIGRPRCYVIAKEDKRIKNADLPE